MVDREGWEEQIPQLIPLKQKGLIPSERKSLQIKRGNVKKAFGGKDDGLVSPSAENGDIS